MRIKSSSKVIPQGLRFRRRSLDILVAVDTENDYIYGVSIPRDTKASINGKNRKINFAYNSGGMELMAQTVSDQLGIPVDYTVLVDLRGFRALVDSIKGVDFYNFVRLAGVRIFLATAFKKSCWVCIRPMYMWSFPLLERSLL